MFVVLDTYVKSVSPIKFSVRRHSISKGNPITVFHFYLPHKENTQEFFLIPCFGYIILVYQTDDFQITELVLEKCLQKCELSQENL